MPQIQSRLKPSKTYYSTITAVQGILQNLQEADFILFVFSYFQFQNSPPLFQTPLLQYSEPIRH